MEDIANNAEKTMKNTIVMNKHFFLTIKLPGHANFPLSLKQQHNLDIVGPIQRLQQKQDLGYAFNI